MMKILSVEPKEIYVSMEMSLSQVEMLLDFLDRSKVVFNGDNEPEVAKAVNYVTQDLYPTLSTVLEQFKGKG